MLQINPYLVFNGNCETAFDFYKSVFGGEFNDFNRFGEMPAIEGQEMPEELKNKIMHVSYNIGSSVLMGSDANPMQGNVVFGQNISLSINAESKEEADKVFNGLADGGQITMPIQNTFWGAYFGMCTDKFSMMWMVNFDEIKNN
jgi:PhnB protein